MITNSIVYNLANAIEASGLPMQTVYAQGAFASGVADLEDSINDSACAGVGSEKAVRRAKGLASALPGTGHNNFLKGVIVSANVTASVKWWTQAERYHFFEIVSSMSTMHRIRRMLEEDTLEFTPATSQNVITAFKELPHRNMSDEEIAMSCPMGLVLTAQITTNYLQLKTMYFQRRYHKLTEWQTFCDWVESLPMAGSLITRKHHTEGDTQ